MSGWAAWMAAAGALASGHGQRLYDQVCAVCHGADGTGAMSGVADLTEPGGALAQSDQALLRSLVDGVQRPGAPLVMPARGGNPALTDDDLRATLDHLRRLTGVQHNVTTEGTTP